VRPGLNRAPWESRRKPDGWSKTILNCRLNVDAETVATPIWVHSSDTF